MRTKFIGLLLGCGLVVATLAPALACPYHNTTATGDQTSPPQTAQSQQPAQDGVN